jgi:hypothetical protein
MFGDLRRAAVIGAVLVFAAGFVVGLIVGRGGGGEDVVAKRITTPAVTDTSTTSTVAIATPAPNERPAIPTQGAILREGTRPLVVASANAPCQSLVTPGAVGECGEVTVSGNRVVWVVERTTTNGITATLTRMLSFVSDENGWVEWLQASDPSGEQWSDVNVVPSDLTGDGVPELLVGFRGTDEAVSLDLDIVGFGQDNLPVVLAHPDAAAHGSVVITGAQMQEYVAQYPGGEPACCPTTYQRQTIAFVDGFFRITATQDVSPNAVPPSQL